MRNTHLHHTGYEMSLFKENFSADLLGCILCPNLPGL